MADLFHTSDLEPDPLWTRAPSLADELRVAEALWLSTTADRLADLRRASKPSAPAPVTDFDGCF